MYEILNKRILAENVNEYTVEAKSVAKHCLAGQFVIIRVDEDGERVPFTICDYDRKAGTVCLLIQTVGATTMKLSQMEVGESLQDIVGPLGNPTDLSEFKKVMLVGGGIGTAVIFPQAKQLKMDNKHVDAIIGARNQSLVMYEDEMKNYCNQVIVMTDDGSNGNKGFVTNALKDKLDANEGYDIVFAVGPLPMMRAVCNLTKEYGIKTVVSLNSMMVDGTGMCGCCRVNVGGETKYACVDGPEFDGHLVDFDEAIMRSKTYTEHEKNHVCKIRGKV